MVKCSTALSLSLSLLRSVAPTSVRALDDVSLSFTGTLVLFLHSVARVTLLDDVPLGYFSLLRRTKTFGGHFFTKSTNVWPFVLKLNGRAQAIRLHVLCLSFLPRGKRNGYAFGSPTETSIIQLMVIRLYALRWSNDIEITLVPRLSSLYFPVTPKKSLLTSKGSTA